MILGLEFPPIENIVEWPNFVGSGWYGFNKIALINVIAVLATTILFVLGRKGALVPKGAQNLAESSVGFIQEGIIMQAIGPDGLRYLPYLASLFFFILIGNLFEIIPFFHMPANARMANPLILALITWAFFIAVGRQAPGPAEVPEELALPSRRPVAALLPRRPDRVPVDLHHPAVLAGRPALRQHARRAHPARDLQRVVHRAVHGAACWPSCCRSRSSCSSPSPASS